MLEAVCENLCTKFLDNHIGEIVLEGFRDSRDHGYADKQAEELQYAEDKFISGKFPRGFENFSRDVFARFFVEHLFVHKITFFVGVKGIAVDQSSKEIRVKE